MNILYNIKTFSFVKNSGGRESLSSKNEEREECIIDLCNGFYELPKFIPGSRIRIKPRLIRISEDIISGELDRIDYIRSLMTIGLIIHNEITRYYNIFESLIEGETKSFPTFFFEVMELNVTDSKYPYIKILVNDREDNFIEIKIHLNYKNNSNGTFNIFTIKSLNCSDDYNKKDILCYLEKILGNEMEFFTFNSSIID